MQEIILPNSKLAAQILFEDQDLLIINKPPGLPSQPTPDPKRSNLYGELLALRKWPYLGLHHRLDAPTSGLMLFTKRKEMNSTISEIFQKHLLQKTYHCLIHQVPEWKEIEIKNHLKQVRGEGGKMMMKSVLSGGDYAETSFQVLASNEEGKLQSHSVPNDGNKEITKQKDTKIALVEAKPKTGRMHQIRVHLKELRHPILGDALYFRADRKYPRLMLHAQRLEFSHPRTKLPLKIEAPYPEDFRSQLKKNFPIFSDSY